MTKEYNADLQDVLNDPQNFNILLALIGFTFLITIVHLFPLIVFTIALMKELFNSDDDDEPRKYISDKLMVTIIGFTTIRLLLNILFDKGTLLNVSMYFISMIFQVLILSNTNGKTFMYTVEILFTLVSFYRLIPGI